MKLRLNDLLFSAGLLLAPAVDGGELPAEIQRPYQRLATSQIDLPMRPSEPVELLDLALDDTTAPLPLTAELGEGAVGFFLAGDSTSGPFLEVPTDNAFASLTFRAQIGTFAIRAPKRLMGLVVGFEYSVGSRYADEIESHWSICVVHWPGDAKPPGKANRARVASCHTTPGDRTNAILALDYAPEARWMHGAVDEDGPAYAARTKVFLRDHDDDGYLDPLLYQREERSAPALTEEEMEARELPDYELVRQQLLHLRFDPDTLRFGEPVPVELAMPPLSWWLFDE
ncbi:MAG: hypothetical protein AAF657_08300 [Acidobacteriota bacterium]